jgi:hypothetical protein
MSATGGKRTLSDQYLRLLLGTSVQPPDEVILDLSELRSNCFLTPRDSRLRDLTEVGTPQKQTSRQLERSFNFR